MDDPLHKALADLLALSKAVDGKDARRIDEIIERLRCRDAHGEQAARLYGKLSR